MTDKDLIKRVAANHLSKKAGLEGSTNLTDKIFMASMALKMAANKKGVMQVRGVFEAIDILLMGMAREIQTTEDPNLKSFGTRLLRKHKAISTELV